MVEFEGETPRKEQIIEQGKAWKEFEGPTTQLCVFNMSKETHFL